MVSASRNISTGGVACTWQLGIGQNLAFSARGASGGEGLAFTVADARGTSCTIEWRDLKTRRRDVSSLL